MKDQQFDTFQWHDPLRFEQQLSEDEMLIANMARAYAQDSLQPRILASYR